MFFRLGVLNVRRQLTRSLLVILTLGLAAISLTYSLSYQHITPPRVSQFLGSFTGGEILVAPMRWAGQQVSDVTEQSRYQFTRLTASGLSWLPWFYPELYSEGFWSEQGQVADEFLDAEDVAQLASYPGVVAVSVTSFLPVVLQMRDDYGPVYIPLLLTPAGDRLSDYACVSYRGDLRQFTLPTTGIAINTALELTRTTHLFEPGDTVQLWLPQVAGSRNAGFSYADCTSVELPFAGYLQVPTRTVSWEGGSPPSLMDETGKFRGAIAWVDETTWSDLLSQAGVVGELPIANLAIQVEDQQQLDEMLVQLGQSFPQFTFSNIGAIEQRLFSTGKMELFEQAPKSVYGVSERVSLVVPASFNRILGLLFLLIAAFLLGGHMLTNVAARAQEIGTLRALGARRRDILALGISEAATTTIIGVTAGFLILRLYGAMMELRGGVPLLSVAWMMLCEYGLVLGISLLASLAFAFFPIWRLASLAPMEVLRNE